MSLGFLTTGEGFSIGIRYLNRRGGGRLVATITKVHIFKSRDFTFVTVAKPLRLLTACLCLWLVLLI